MLLLGVTEENGWLASTFNLTYAVGWDKICKAVSMIYSYYENVEILVDNEKMDISSKEEILKLEEAGNMTIRGISTIIKVPIMITFFNQLQNVNVTVPCMKGEFENADYQKFNMSLGQYMDSLELAMYR
ncbi:MAG: hypothetical protein PHP31_08670 [Lentimicrobiaceae bacterium]|nr:hypothetical protein [Lentimicrobiaceae bacterium]